MSWNSSMEVQYKNHSVSHNSMGSFVDFFGDLTYDQMNYVFAEANYVEDDAYNAYSAYPASNTSLYKFAVSEPGSFSYCEYGNGYMVDNHNLATIEYSGHLDNVPVVDGDRATVLPVHQERNSNTGSHAHPVEFVGPRNHQDARGSEVAWQDNIDPDNMTYEELLELGETVGTENRGLSQEQIALLPTSKFKLGFFSRKKFKGERCVICQMEYKRGDKRMVLPCKHIYHTSCGTKWLGINKACPICYKEVVIDVAHH